MTIPITEEHPQHLPAESRQLLGKRARKILNITPICFNAKPGEVVRLYYYAHPTGGRSVIIQKAPNDTRAFGLCLELDITKTGVHPSGNEKALAQDAQEMGYTPEGFCKMIERLSLFDKSDFPD